MGVEGKAGRQAWELPSRTATAAVERSRRKGLADHFWARHSVNIFWAKLLGRIEAWLILKKIIINTLSP